MNAECLLAHFETISEAPDAIPRLRRFILDLAVRGKLVEQDPEDEPAEELLRCVIKHKKSPLFNSEDQSPFPFNLPTGWVHTTLRSLVEASSLGWSPKALDTPREGDEWGILKVSAVSWDRFRPEANKQILPGTQPKPQAVIRTGDFLISRANTAELVARAVIVEIEPVNLMMSDKIVRLELVELCEPKYILINNNHSTFSRSYYAERATGVSPSMKNVTRDVILDLPIPLPPLAEQHRIVAKVDELMALCDQLDAARQQREQTRERLVAASLQRLNQPSEDPASFRQHAQFALQTLPSLTTTPAQIKQLRQTILNLAVRGKLVEQDPEDEPAEELFCRYLEKRIVLVSQGKIRRPKPSSPIRDEDLPINLPRGWTWARFNEIGNLSGGMTPSMGRADYWDGSIVWLSPKDIKSDEVSESELKLSELGLSEGRLELYPPGCLFIVARSGILKRTLPVSINRVPAAANQDMKVLAPFVQGQERYLQIMLRGLTDFVLTSLVKTGTTVQSLKYGEFAEQPFPIPPLAEQHRIVAKVDELMTLCDQLEQQLSQADQQRRQLLEAVLAEALAKPEPVLEGLVRT